jgi:hypothetical protein
MSFVFIYENRKMEHVEIVIRRREGKREKDRGGKSNQDILQSHM